MRITLVAAVWMFVPAALLLPADLAVAQSFRHDGTEFNAVRRVMAPAETSYTAVVVEFLHHGEIHPDGRNVVVVAKNRELVPCRVLQLGPGDFCRLAFQTIKGQREYDVLYGGPTPRDNPPPWTCRDGLLLETRHYRPCNFRNLKSVQSAFDAATPIGADYVDGVFQAENPFSLKREPFLSRYTGWIDLPKTGVYGFITSSQDCSFLSIDDKLVASAPGYHGPARRAFRGSRHDVELAAGSHKFQYDHAAAGHDAMMVAAWEINPTDPKPSRPTRIPAEAFGSQRIGHLAAGGVSLRTTRYVPDFAVKIVGDVPLPDNDVPLVGVQFRDASPKSLAIQAKFQWNFGDGQTSNLPNADHVYLRPGLYSVKLSILRGGKTVDMANRIYVDRPPLTDRDKPHTLSGYLRVIETYDPKTLDAVALRQMVLALEAKSLALADEAKHAAQIVRAAEDDPNRRPGAMQGVPLEEEAESQEFSAESRQYAAKAVNVGRVAFADGSAANGDADLLRLAQLIGPMARFRMGNAELAFQIWRGAARHISAAQPKAECEIAAADVAVNDLADAAAAKPLLDAAKKHFDTGRSGPIAADWHRVSGDYDAATGDGRSARKEYNAAESSAGSSKNFVERTAWLGAHARSTEAFLRAKQYVRAVEELRAWQREFPADKIDGYWSLLFANYWAARGKYAQAIAQAEQLQAVNPDSPYIDRLLYLAAESEMRRGRKDRALATLHSLVKDYPGSPLAPLAKKDIESLEGGKKD